MNADALYTGTIEHRRFAPRENMFTYGVCYYFLNLEKVPEVFNGRFLFTFNKPGLLAFWEKNYLQAGTVREAILESTHRKSFGPIKILTNVSYFGFCFNPVSFYYCYSEDGKTLEFIVSEITNTPWGEKHRQVFEMKETAKSTFLFPKGFHVSPFMPMTIDYTWIFGKPQEELYVFMQNRSADQTEVIFDSTLRLKRKDLSRTNIIFSFLRYPLVTFKTVLAIHYQALKLYLKKVPFHNHPTKGNV